MRYRPPWCAMLRAASRWLMTTSTPHSEVSHGSGPSPTATPFSNRHNTGTTCGKDVLDSTELSERHIHTQTQVMGQKQHCTLFFLKDGNVKLKDYPHKHTALFGRDQLLWRTPVVTFSLTRFLRDKSRTFEKAITLTLS